MDKLIHLILLSVLVSIPGSLEENIARKGTATQSSTYSTWAAPHAIDGVRHGPDPDDVIYCSATASQSNPWWRLDLLDVYGIKTVIITARSDGALSQTNGAEIRIGNSLENNGNNNPICAVTSGFLAGNTVSYSCGVMVGRYVNVVMTGRTSVLALCEVEVYESENLAFKGNATKSSPFNIWLAANAIDGKRYGSPLSSVCSATDYKSNPWWRLDLQDVYYITTVIITVRPDCCPDQTNGAEILVGNSLENNGNNNSR
ncbi:fucolectin-1-like [Triplophysa rosa]|uniref:fucolectin-1-like n=1 Tax=Triplophysa rosa TaxID=992332 RepID=UPI002546082A|nr:fucolectin-1-like [Triplophysa rosa]